MSPIQTRPTLMGVELPPFATSLQPARRSSSRAENAPNLAKIRAKKRANNSYKLGLRLRAEAEKQSDVSSLVDADLLILSGNPEAGNHVIFENLLDKKGRRFEAPLQLVALPTRFDMGYQRKSAYGNFKSIVEQFERSDIRKALADETLFAYFITPTFPNLIGRNLAENDVFYEELSRRFRDSDYYKRVIKAAFRKTEFTCGKARERKEQNIVFDYRTHGYNFHAHYAAVTCVKFSTDHTDRENVKLARVYTNLAKQLHREMFLSPLPLKKSQLCVVDVRPIDLTDRGKGFFYEMSKYLSKSSSFLELEPSELLSANQIFRNKKLLTATGLFTNKKGRQKQTERVETGASSLDKHPSSMSELLPDDSDKLPPLKEFGVYLCQNGKRDLWLKMLPELFAAKVRQAKRRFLARHPNAVIVDLLENEFDAYRRERTEDEKLSFAFPSAASWRSRIVH